MTNLLLLMIVYLAYLGLSFWLFNGNFLSPSIVFCASMSAMLCLAYYTATTMGMLFAIGLETFSIFAVGGLIFVMSELCVYLLKTSSCSLMPVREEAKREPLIISPQIQFCVACFMLISLLIAIVVVYANSSGGAWSERMRHYKQTMLYHPEALQFRIVPGQIYRSLYKINIVTADLFGYVMIYNLTVCKVPVKTVLMYIVTLTLYALFSAVFLGGRQSAIEVILYLIMIYISLNMKPGGKQKIYRFIQKMIPVIVLIAALFTFAGEYVGRYKVTTKSSFENLAEYICGGLYAFNHHIDDPRTKHFGQASLSYIYAIPQNLGLVPRDTDNMVTGEFDIYGNTVTIFGRWYQDFGVTGVFVITAIVSVLYSLTFYRKLIYSDNVEHENHASRIFYCQFMTGLVWAGYDDRIAPLLALQSLFFMIFVRFLFWLLIDKKFKLF